MKYLRKFKLKIIVLIVIIYSITLSTTTYAAIMDNINSMMNNYKSTIFKSSSETDESELEDNIKEYKESLEYIPTKYRINGVTVGNQTNSGWCWAYASLKTVDTYFMKKYNTTNSGWNFSEAHLAYSRYKPFGGWINLVNNDSENKTDGKVAWETGGGFSIFLKYAGLVKKQTDDINDQYKIMGPVKESSIPNTQYEFTQSNIQKFNNATKEVKVLKAIEFQHIKKNYTRKDGYVYTQYTDEKGNELSKAEVEIYRNKIKSHIMNYSGLCAGTHQFNTATNYWNKDTSAFFTADNDNAANHVICIVGWDDDFSREKFNSENKPYNNGAWIAVNSFGTEYGYNGFLYISYDDANVDENMGGILEAEAYSAKPRVEVKYSRDENNNVTVYLSSPERLELSDWRAAYIGTRKIDNETIYTTETNLTKSYKDNKKETIKVKDQSGAETQVEIDTENGGLLAQIKTEKTDTVNKLKVKIIANQAINNLDELKLSNDSNIESYNLADDGKELQIIYINNTEEDLKIAGRYILKDALGNQCVVNLSNQNIVIPTKVFKIDINTKYQEIKKGETTYISNISQDTTLENLINNINTNSSILIYKNNTKITDKNTKISTGMKVQALYNNKTYEYRVVVNGDTSGDGQIDIKDILAINKHRLNKTLLKDEYELAGDVNQDNKVDLKDLLQVNKFRLGKIKKL